LGRLWNKSVREWRLPEHEERPRKQRLINMCVERVLGLQENDGSIGGE